MKLLTDREILALNIVQNGVSHKVSTNESGEKIASYGLEPLGYTFTLGNYLENYTVYHEGMSRSCIYLGPGDQVTGVTAEAVYMPKDVTILNFTGKSSYICRQGLILHATQVEPGYRGILTFCLTNLSPKSVQVYLNEGILQANFIQVSEMPQTSYVGYYGEGKQITSAIH